ncbi:MAG: hypothetical protein H6867_06390 [Rhodospirillales bacterium]|nr:hypothetical protein [Rhodospirillales bacterium]MCB9995177.1 hypothetical protein [Rhodospirillales bacterium]
MSDKSLKDIFQEEMGKAAPPPESLAQVYGGREVKAIVAQINRDGFLNASIDTQFGLRDGRFTLMISCDRPAHVSHISLFADKKRFTQAEDGGPPGVYFSSGFGLDGCADISTPEGQRMLIEKIVREVAQDVAEKRYGAAIKKHLQSSDPGFTIVK